MKTSKKLLNIKKSVLIFTLLTFCLSLSALAASGVLQGFFKDVTNAQGSVIGTAYEQADSEITLTANIKEDALIATATFSAPGAAPYAEAETLGIAAYRIVDAAGKTVAKGAADPAAVSENQAAIVIHLNNIEEGRYTLIVTSFTAEKKADQPLPISGYWECSFIK